MMTSAKPRIGDRDLLTATQTCGVLGISLSTLRGYVRDGMISFRESHVNGRRLYLGREVMQLWRMRHR